MVARTGLFVAPLPGSTPIGTSPTDGRLVLGSLFGIGGGCMSGGVLTASATQMQVTVAAAVWRIPDPTNAAGVYLSPADADVFTFAAGPASGSRIDVLWVRQNNYEAGDANSRLVYGVTAGTAASTPVAPATPAGAMKIGQLTVPSGAANAAACTLVGTYAGQAVTAPSLLVASEAQLPAVGAYYGQLAVVQTLSVAGSTTSCVERWNGTAWRRWDCDWLAYGPTLAGVGAQSNAGRWRYMAGKVCFEFAASLSGVPYSQIWASVPVANDNNAQNQPVGKLIGKDASDGYRNYVLGADWGTTAQIAFTAFSGSSGALTGANGSSPFPWDVNDIVLGVIEYDPA